MTHDELLALINKNAEDCEPDCNKHRWANAPWLALRTVVELHKPMKIGETLTVCRECFVMWENIPYPCATIQAIERELNE